MKRRIIWVTVFIIIYNLYASPEYINKTFFHTDEYATICISEDKLIFDDGEEIGQLIQSEKYDCFYSDKTKYAILCCSIMQSQFLTIIKKNELSKDLYSTFEMTFVKTEKDAIYDRIKLVPFKVSKVDSFISEKDKKGNVINFLPDALFSMNSNPWAVMKNEKKNIYINTERWRKSNIQYCLIKDMVFVNGFVFPDKDYLYEQNSRAKLIRISYNKTSFKTELQDTGNFQVVHLPTPINPTDDNNIKIEIIDSYPGTKYSDIVISGIYYMDAVIK